AGKNLTTLTSGPAHVSGLTWSPAGTELWFTAGEVSNRGLYAVTLAGRQRLVYRLPGDATLQDISSSGRILLPYGLEHFGVVVSVGGAGERELVGFDRPRIGGVQADGLAMLVDDEGEAGGDGSIYLRLLDGSPSRKLGTGRSWGLSPDGKWALA